MTTETRNTFDSQLTKKQVKVYGPKKINYGGDAATITAEVRWDDNCGNGHNSFAITGTISGTDRRKYRHDDGFITGGCIHEEIAKHFPELAPFIKWHLSGSDGPMHYVANAMYMASDRDHYGRAKGEESAWEYGVRFDEVPVTHRVKHGFWQFLMKRLGTGDFQVTAIAHEERKGESYKFSPNYTFVGYGEKWHECPFKDKTEADEFCEAMNRCDVRFLKVPTAWSEGKARELDNARSAAVWPDATDEDLTAPGLKERLETRLAGLMVEMRKDIESIGLVW